jgi:XisI protein
MATQSTLNNQTTPDKVKLIEQILHDYARIPYAHGDLHMQTVFDREAQRFLLLTLGWNGIHRVHHVVVDVELRGETFWIHRDRTEDGIATDLEQAGIPKEQIVLAWHSERERVYTGYAVS